MHPGLADDIEEDMNGLLGMGLVGWIVSLVIGFVFRFFTQLRKSS